MVEAVGLGAFEWVYKRRSMVGPRVKPVHRILTKHSNWSRVRFIRLPKDYLEGALRERFSTLGGILRKVEVYSFFLATVNAIGTSSLKRPL